MARLIAANVEVRVRLEMEAHTGGEVQTANVVGEIRGAEKPAEIVVIGAHLDSWDVGQGAQDDGAGVIHVIEAIARDPRPRARAAAHDPGRPVRQRGARVRRRQELRRRAPLGAARRGARDRLRRRTAAGVGRHRHAAAARLVYHGLQADGPRRPHRRRRGRHQPPAQGGRAGCGAAGDAADRTSTSTTPRPTPSTRWTRRPCATASPRSPPSPGSSRTRPRRPRNRHRPGAAAARQVIAGACRRSAAP